MPATLSNMALKNEFYSKQISVRSILSITSNQTSSQMKFKQRKEFILSLNWKKQKQKPDAAQLQICVAKYDIRAWLLSIL